MNNEQKNKVFFRSAFDELRAPDGLTRKVKQMNAERTKRRTPLLKAVCVVAILVTVFISSNVVAYAASGATWVERVMMSVTVNGEDMKVPVDVYEDESGNSYATASFEVGDGDENGEVNQGTHHFSFEMEGAFVSEDGVGLEVNPESGAE